MAALSDNINDVADAATVFSAWGVDFALHAAVAATVVVDSLVLPESVCEKYTLALNPES